MARKRVTRSAKPAQPIPEPDETVCKIELDTILDQSSLPMGSPEFVPSTRLISVFQKVSQALVDELRHDWRLFMEERRIVVEWLEQVKLEDEWIKEDEERFVAEEANWREGGEEPSGLESQDKMCLMPLDAMDDDDAEEVEDHGPLHDEGDDGADVPTTRSKAVALTSKPIAKKTIKPKLPAVKTVAKKKRGNDDSDVDYDNQDDDSEDQDQDLVDSSETMGKLKPKKKKWKRTSDAAEIPPPLKLEAETAAGSDALTAGKKLGCPKCPKTFAVFSTYRLE